MADRRFGVGCDQVLVVEHAHESGQRLNDFTTIYKDEFFKDLATLRIKAFRHVHDLSLRFHLDRRTGSLTSKVHSSCPLDTV